MLRAAGIEVITTVNIQHLESLNEAVRGHHRRAAARDRARRGRARRRPDPARRHEPRRAAPPTGPRQRLSSRADRRLARLVLPAGQPDRAARARAAVAGRPGRHALDDYRRTQGIDQPWPTRERVVVAVTGGPESETLLRRAGRIAQRGAGGELVAVHVVRGDGLAGPRADLATIKRLVDDLGGTFHTVVGEDVPTSVIEFARGVNASLVVVGVSSHARLWRIFRGTTASDMARLSGAIDVHLVTHEQAGSSGGLRAAPLHARRDPHPAGLGAGPAPARAADPALPRRPHARRLPAGGAGLPRRHRPRRPGRRADAVAGRGAGRIRAAELVLHRPGRALHHLRADQRDRPGRPSSPSPPRSPRSSTSPRGVRPRPAGPGPRPRHCRASPSRC